MVVLASALGCSGESAVEARTSADSATATAAAEASAGGTSDSASNAAPDATLDATRALATIEHLSVEIGPRPAGSEAERQAA
ncbi:MAG: hypothetical protein KC461_13145, partial [Dehalococcoidia bacterium]|nr:hypothetical protein [Dehalococcoidia bacterium]